MKNEWIKVGVQVYVISRDGRVRSGLATITKIGKKYFYTDYYRNVSFSIEKLEGGEKGYGISYYVFQSKESYDLYIEMIRRRNVLKEKVHLFTDSEINELYNIVIQRDK